MSATLLRSVLGTLVFVLATAGASAQDASGPDPARVAAAKELMVAMDVQEQFQKTTAAMKDLLTQQMQSQPGGDKMKAVMDKIFDPSSEGIKTYFTDAEGAYVNFFASRFTVEELKEIAVFQSSPVGKKMQASMPDMIAALGPPLAKFQESIKKQVLEELQAKPKP
jgi:hypothetical protein